MYQAGLVLEGGGMKGVYTAGVLDFFTEKGIDFSHISWILGNVTRIPRHELPQTLDFSDFLPLFT